MRLRSLLSRTPWCSKKKGNNDLDQMHSYYFIYWIILGNNSDNFVLNKYIVRSSLYIINTYNKFVVHSLFIKSVLGNNIEVR